MLNTQKRLGYPSLFYTHIDIYRHNHNNNYIYLIDLNILKLI